MEIEDVVMRLVGPIHPVGDSRVDLDRQASLRELCDITGALLDRIEQVAHMPEDHRGSVAKTMGIAAAFLSDTHARGVEEKKNG